MVTHRINSIGSRMEANGCLCTAKPCTFHLPPLKEHLCAIVCMGTTDPQTSRNQPPKLNARNPIKEGERDTNSQRVSVCQRQRQREIAREIETLRRCMERIVFSQSSFISIKLPSQSLRSVSHKFFPFIMQRTHPRAAAFVLTETSNSDSSVNASFGCSIAARSSVSTTHFPQPHAFPFCADQPHSFSHILQSHSFTSAAWKVLQTHSFPSRTTFLVNRSFFSHRTLKRQHRKLEPSQS
mmetsp:Transcript_8528/g.16676  ORF Transcript_8528/g.16676 Transcript_8528/m.16676 type:complete len:239 (+) Transcript_8528:196-912(+)